jgi:hypothetical protein
MKKTLCVLAVAATVLSACGGDDDDVEISDATPQGRLTIALADEYEKIFDVDRACIEERTAVLTDEQAERAIDQIQNPTIDDDLQDWLTSTSDCIEAP